LDPRKLATRSRARVCGTRLFASALHEFFGMGKALRGRAVAPPALAVEQRGEDLELGGCRNASLTQAGVRWRPGE
jgi:hypothetical protein